MKKKSLILCFTMFIFVFINCKVYAMDEYSTDVILNKIYAEDPGYSYDLLWDDMTFTYTESKSFTYNESIHDYDLTINGYWSDENNKVSISNNSLSDINVSLLYKSNDLYGSVIGTFVPNDFTLKYNEKTESKLKLNGKVNKNNDKIFTIGTITISIK